MEGKGVRVGTLRSGVTKEAPVLGILGGGQLARMLIPAAARVGIACHVYAPGESDVATQVCGRTSIGSFEDSEAIAHFARQVDVVTVESENIPLSALEVVSGVRTLRPNLKAIAVAQDRWQEKQFLSSVGLRTVAYARLGSEDDLEAALAAVPMPAILKTNRMGYDGKGQAVVGSPAECRSGWVSLDSVDCVLEERVEFVAEMSVIAARSEAGDFISFDPSLNHHEGGILRSSQVPCGLDPAVQTAAIHATRAIVESLDYVGVIGVEFFVLPEGGLIVNEIAPRVHNSGHWTQNGCVVDQFEQHVRAVMGLPLGDGSRHSDVTMLNLLGRDVLDVEKYMRDPNAGVHIYGKTPVRPGRKMGHVNLRSAAGPSSPSPH